VDQSGQNSIVVASGANFVFPASDVEGTRSSFHGARFTLFQLETPLPAVEAALHLARSEGSRTILDPAPAQPLPPSFLTAVDILTPNESEASILLGRPASRVDVADAPEISRALLALGPAAVILKLGENGCFYAGADQQIHAPGFRVHAVDTTAAGDTFNAALAVALAEEMPLERALAFANAAAAISVTRAGAQASIPSRAETDGFLSERA
jgi:ribokinase